MLIVAALAGAALALGGCASAMLSPAVNRTLSDGTFRGATAKAARMAGFCWEQADVAGAVTRLTAPVLFVHGGADTLIPPEHSRRLSAAAPSGSRLIELPADDHFSLSVRLDRIADDVVAWFDAGWGTPAGGKRP